MQSMLLVYAATCAAVGVAIVIASFRSRARRNLPEVPPAKVHDGRPLEEPARGPVNWLQLLLGLAIMIGGTAWFIGMYLYASIPDNYNMGRPLRRRGRPRLP